MLNSSDIHLVVGARPNYMKAKVLLELLPDATLIHTGQHFTPELGEEFLNRLGIRQPDVILNPERGSQAQLWASLMVQLEEHWQESRPKLLIVFGDVNSTAAAALVASRMGIQVAHVEAGLRSRDLKMPEEVNRILTDACSDLLLCSEPSGVNNLRAEGRSQGVHLVGNAMIDCLVSLRPMIDQSDVLDRLNLTPNEYAVCTFHRPANVDHPDHFSRLLQDVDQLGHPFVFPVHPRVKITDDCRNITRTPPLFYTDFMRLVSQASYVLTDSGGRQEETSFLGVPCLTYRTTTERPVTIDQGTNRLLPDFGQVHGLLDEIRQQEHQPIENWDGRASHRMVDILLASDTSQS